MTTSLPRYEPQSAGVGEELGHYAECPFTSLLIVVCGAVGFDPTRLRPQPQTFKYRLHESTSPPLSMSHDEDWLTS